MPAPSTATFSRLADLIAIPDADSRPTKTITEVFTGKELATIPVGTAADALAAIARVRTAQAAWAKRPVSERAEIFHRYRDLVLAHRDELRDDGLELALVGPLQLRAPSRAARWWSLAHP